MTGKAIAANGQILPLASIPVLPYAQFTDELVRMINNQARLVAYFADQAADPSIGLEVYAVLAQDQDKTLAVMRSRLGRIFAAITPKCPQFHLFEREIAEQYGVVPIGHPWLKPVRFHQPWTSGEDAWGRDPSVHPVPGDMKFFQAEGAEVHEVAVGPVHAGVIEPGHFRFQCHGEQVIHLEISLGYQHRGVEQLLAGGPWPHTASQIETLAGDTTVGHMSAYSQLLETLAGGQASPRAQTIRAIGLELERLCNHVGDIGALAGDIGFLPTAAYCGRLRGDYLNMTALISGSRFGRGLVRPGGVLFDIDPAMRDRLLQMIADATVHTRGALDLFFDAPSVLARLDGVGKVAAADAVALGLTGGAGRACGLDCDVRRHHPTGIYRRIMPDAMLELAGDVFARARIRQREILHSIDFICQQLETLPAGELTVSLRDLQPESLAISLVEGWRGRIAHVALTGQQGRFRRYKVVDPSFFNWSGLAMALRDEQISDFPLCNKSFNLSYCGVDL